MAPEPNATWPVSDVPIGVVAGGSGVKVRTWHPAASLWVAGITVAVIAPESMSVPLGIDWTFLVPECGAGLDAGAQLVSIAAVVKDRRAEIPREVLKVNTVAKACTFPNE